MSRPFSSDHADASVMIDWSTAPEWAKYHAFNSDGRGGWHQNLPSINQVVPLFWGQAGYCWPSGYQLPYGEIWQDSLTARNQSYSSDHVIAALIGDRTLPPCDPAQWPRYRVIYAVTTPSGETIHGFGKTVAVDDDHAQTYALGLLYALCRPCDCFTGHSVSVERIDPEWQNFADVIARGLAGQEKNASE